MNLLIEGINLSGKTTLVNNIKNELKLMYSHEFHFFDFNSENNNIFDLINYNLKYSKIEEESKFMFQCIKYFEHYKDILLNRKFTISESGIISLFNYDIDITYHFEYLANLLQGYLPDKIIYIDVDPIIILERNSIAENEYNFIEEMNKLKDKHKNFMNYIHQRTQGAVSISIVDGNKSENNLASDVLSILK